MAIAKDSQQNALTVVDFAPPVIDREAIAEELDGLTLQFDRVKIPSGGGLAFELPGDGDEPEVVREIVGVIVDHHPTNAYWKDKYAGANVPPDCASLDGKMGVATMESGLEWAGRANACKTCPLNQFGSGEGGRGKACKNMHRLYILRPGTPFPVLLTLPPTSLANFANYLSKRVLAKGYRSSSVLTRIKLQAAQNSGGIKYSEAVFSVAGVLNDQDAAHMAAYSEGIKRTTRGLAVSAEDYGANGSGGSAGESYEPF